MKKSLYILMLLLVSMINKAESFTNNYAKQSNRIEDTIKVDGRIRSYILYLPKNYEEKQNVALVIFLHGGGGKASQAEKDYGFNTKADEEGLAVVYPDGTNNGRRILGLKFWNAGTCCKDASENSVNDVKFISMLINKLTGSFRKLDAKKVYATGMSNGAMMAYRLAAELSDKIAAVAPVSGTLMCDVKNVSRAVPILHIHSLQDSKVPYKGGKGIDGIEFSSVDYSLKTWIKQNNCNDNPAEVIDKDKYVYKKWADKNGNTLIECYLTKDGGHAWPGGKKARLFADTPSKAINANDVIVNFFKKYQLP